ncbi:hypothetical protein [Massilia sp. BJB1822]|uniref:hypothetical protein n=1 Tax=Massilia sp. BJB1822 TaxID=2744470 RepID=UPI001594815D|nr:hypothetical protein [Massilia sp. BJB1822]NVD97731.1 hypothetical protein [Massilia sp. BJB1822]
MTMRTLPVLTHLTSEQACTPLELLDHVRDLLAQAYGGDIAAMLRATIPCRSQATTEASDDPTF